MKQSVPQSIYLKDYKVPTHFIHQVNLTFKLHPTKTLVHSVMKVSRNPESKEQNLPLVLNGDELTLQSIQIDGNKLSDDQYTLEEYSLSVQTPEKCILTIENLINPEANTALDGLYASGNILCTQCEPHGFRRITYFLDRPDNMARYRVKLIGDKKRYPIMLSNGNCVGKGDLPEGQHFADWEDPFKKPSYLFAIVAGDLGSIEDTFTTCSGRTIDLRVYCDKGNETRCQHALDSLKKSMLWDEQRFGLEYDLDLFMIVAVDAFNFGAMENKGLNIFNTSAALADSKTETDENFYRVESIVAHEYFHNWTGNRITCRDWFQLTLKEGLTVFRDQEFSSDINCRPVERIRNVSYVRSAQFSEDAGPMAHPIKPDQYIQINNFYTATVYRKGSEIIRMIQTLIGEKTFRKGIDQYFELFDEQAVTTEDFVHAMHLASGFDFGQFKRWYHQAGTPEVAVTWEYNENEKTFSLHVRQHCDPTADNSAKEPFFFPFEVGLVGSNGQDLPVSLSEGSLIRKKDNGFILEISKPSQTFRFSNVLEKPVCSLNRDFTAPVKVTAPHTEKESLFLMAHDSDHFNRWDAGRELGTHLLLNGVKTGDHTLDKGYSRAFAHLLEDVNLDPSLKALALTLPSEATLAQRQNPIDFEGNHNVREAWIKQLAEEHHTLLIKHYQNNQVTGPYKFTPEAMGKRELANTCLSYLSRLKSKEVIKLCQTQYFDANNMTDAIAPLQFLCNIECVEREEVLKDFYQKWSQDPLVMCKWFAAQASSKLKETLENVSKLTQDPVYTIKIPNIVRALWGSFQMNLIHFHKKDGSGYKKLADTIIELDSANPMVASLLAKAYRDYKRLDSERAALVKVELDRILKISELSNNCYEIISKTLNARESEKTLV